MNCAELEILICDYVDGTLAPAEKAVVERHLAGCPSCAEMARDSAAAVAFMERAADVEPPPELVTRILFERTVQRGPAKNRSSWLVALLSPILQPKYAMGMAMTILSVSMLAKFVAPVRPLQPADLQPTRIWAGLEERAERAWGRSVKFYENLKFVYQIQTMLHDWQQQNEDQRPASDQKTAEPGADDRKLPVRPAPLPGATVPGGAPLSNPSGEPR